MIGGTDYEALAKNISPSAALAVAVSGGFLAGQYESASRTQAERDLNILLNRSGDMGMESLPCICEYFGDKKTEQECRLIAFELSSLHELAVLRHKEMKSICGIDLTDDKVLEEYVRQTTQRYLV